MTRPEARPPAAPSLLPRRWVVALGVVALLVPTLPNAVYLHAGDSPAFWLGQVATSVLLVAMPLLAGCSLRTNLIVLLPFALGAPAAVGFARFTGIPPSVLALQILEEATREELSVFLPQLVLCGLAMLVVGLGYGTLICAGRLGDVSLNWRARTACLVLLTAFLAKDVIVGHSGSAARLLGHRLEKMAPVAPVVLAVRLRAGGDLRRDRSGLFLHHTVRQRPDRARDEVALLVIGEAARKGDLGLYSPAVGSNPRLLARSAELVVFQNAATCATLTAPSLPVILTGRLPGKTDGAEAVNLGLVEAFRLAGFHTVWLSNQPTELNSLSVMSAFSASAREKIQLNIRGGLGPLADSTRLHHFDGALLEPLAAVLRTNPGRLFVVVHLHGSHQPYLLRYPPAFEKWPVGLSAKKSMRTWLPPYNLEQQAAINRARLNSAYYTDWVLDQLLTLVHGTGRPAIVGYVSDHGENLPDAPVMPAMHGTPTDDVLNIPLFFWFSDSMKVRESAKLSALATNVPKHVSTIDLFATFCGLFDLVTPAADPAMNLASAGYREHDLWVVDWNNNVTTVRR
jgi:heptose-I-phosphate ethanolaminephosphotransferase